MQGTSGERVPRSAACRTASADMASAAMPASRRLDLRVLPPSQKQITALCFPVTAPLGWQRHAIWELECCLQGLRQQGTRVT
jgi:hypothetical protein